MYPMLLLFLQQFSNQQCALCFDAFKARDMIGFVRIADHDIS